MISMPRAVRLILLFGGSIGMLTAQTAETVPTIEKLIDSERLPEARKRLEQTVQANGETARSLFLLSMILYKEKRFEESLEVVKTSLARDHEQGNAYKLMALDLAALNRGDEVAAVLEKAVELAPKDFMAWYYLGYARFRVFKYGDAVQPLRRSIELNPNYSESYYLLGVALEQLRRQPEAERVYRDLIGRFESQKMTSDRPYLFLGRLLFTMDRYADAVEPLDRAARLDPTTVDAWKFLGRSYKQLGRTEDARAALEKALGLSPGDRETRYLLLQVYRALGMDERAAEQAKAIQDLSTAAAKR